MSVRIEPYKKRNGEVDGWMVDIRVRLADGKRHRERLKAPVSSQSGAKKWGLDRIAHIIRHGLTKTEEVNEEKQTITFKDFGSQYLDGKEADGDEVKPSYLQFMRYTIDGHLSRQFGTLRLNEITEQKIDEFRRTLKMPRQSGKVRSDKGVNNVLALLGKMLRTAKDKGLIATVPIVTMLKREQRAKRNKPKIKADGVSCYTDAQFAKLLGAAEGVSHDAYVITLLGGDHGLRRGEIMALKWSDLDLDAGVITVNRSVWLHEGKAFEGVPKGGCSRELELTDALKMALTVEKKSHGRHVLPRYTYAAFADVIRDVQRAAGFAETGKAHVLRHTFCSRLAMKGVAVRTIQALAGHANIETTERYLHSDREQERQAMRLLSVTGAKIAA